MGQAKKRKEITFDLNQSKLKEFYPKPVNSRDELFYKKAYKDIRRFMVKNSFLWRQGSVYVSIEKLTRMDIAELAIRMVKTLPWLGKCVNAIDVADISEQQYSLLDYLKRAGEIESGVEMEPITNHGDREPFDEKLCLEVQISNAEAKKEIGNTIVKKRQQMKHRLEEI